MKRIRKQRLAFFLTVTAVAGMLLSACGDSAGQTEQASSAVETVSEDSGFTSKENKDSTEADIREAIAQIQQEDFVPLDDDMLDGVSGGGKGRGSMTGEACRENPNRSGHIWEKTGNTRPGSWIGLIDDVPINNSETGKKV